MISNRDILVLSDDLSGLPTSTIHLFKHIAPSNRVIWLNIISRMPRPTLHDFRKLWRLLWQLVNKQDVGPASFADDDISGIIFSGTPLIVPVFKKPLRKLNKILLKRFVADLCKRFDFENPIIITTWPSTVDFVASFDADKTVYYCVDDWANYPLLNSTDFLRMESELMDFVDGFVATSQRLYDKRRDASKSLYLPHGVDYEHFTTAPSAPPELPESLSVSGTVVGFFGLIAEWIDLDLIIYLAQRFPELRFVLIGKAVVDTSRVEALSNVALLPELPYDELPSYARRFDIGLIPFLSNDLTMAVNPLKLMEYLSIGIPVLSTRLPDLERVSGPVYLAKTQAEFGDQLEQILASKGDRSEPQAIARANSWQRRANELSDFLESL